MTEAEPVRSYLLTSHALLEMARRGIEEHIVRSVLERPDQRLPIRTGRDILQSQVQMGGKTYLVHVFVDVDRSPAEVVTVYRTSKIEKYWREES
ncbi:MAG: DUF4258 domain-containing protein [bacterium]